MARNFEELRSKMSPQAQQRAARLAADYNRQMPLADLRNAQELTQARLAEIMEVEQSEVSRIERRTDIYVSTLRSYIEAMGGRLVIQAQFPQGAIEINQFEETSSPVS